MPSAATVISVHAAPVGVLRYRGRDVRSAIAKQPIRGTATITASGLDGDEQADPRYHGGPEQALCVYPAEHYDAWAGQLGLALTAGAFGENLLTRGLTEQDVCLADIFELGSARVQLTAPRTPCYKPGVYNRATRLKQAMKDTGRVGYYLSVLEPGELTAGSSLTLLSRTRPQLTVEAAYRARRDRDQGLIRQLLEVDELAPRYRADLQARAR